MYADRKVQITPCPLKEAHCPPRGWEQATPEKLRRLYADQDNVASFAALRAQLDSQQPSLVAVAGGAAGDGGDGGGGEERGDPILPVPPSIIGTWDDHDFGLNDGDGRLTIKEESAVCFLDFMREPKESARRSRLVDLMCTINALAAALLCTPLQCESLHRVPALRHLYLW